MRPTLWAWRGAGAKLLLAFTKAVVHASKTLSEPRLGAARVSGHRPSRRSSAARAPRGRGSRGTPPGRLSSAARSVAEALRGSRGGRSEIDAATPTETTCAPAKVREHTLFPKRLRAPSPFWAQFGEWLPDFSPTWPTPSDANFGRIRGRPKSGGGSPQSGRTGQHRPREGQMWAESCRRVRSTQGR